MHALYDACDGIEQTCLQVKTDAMAGEFPRMTSGLIPRECLALGYPINSARKYIMPPILTVTPNEIEQLIECVRSIGHTFTIPKAITMMPGLQCLEGNCQKWKRRAIAPYGPIFVGSFNTFQPYGHKHLLIPRSGP